MFAYDNFGFSVSGAGDVDNDGYDEVIVGAPANDAGGENAGRAYVFGCEVEEGYLCGDCTEDGVVDIGDVVFIINYLFREGDPPAPLCIGDVNCDDVVDIGDVVYLINYLFRGDDPPCPYCCL